MAAASAPRAGGHSGRDRAARTCPDPVPVMVMHGARDALFPGYGAEAAAWWAACNRCEAEPSAPRDDGCVVYTGCVDGAETLYCEADTPHTAWPERNKSLMRFFVEH